MTIMKRPDYGGSLTGFTVYIYSKYLLTVKLLKSYYCLLVGLLNSKSVTSKFLCSIIADNSTESTVITI